MGKVKIVFLATILLCNTVAYGLEITEADYNRIQSKIHKLPVGERIALWAEEFIGTPYDPDPLGEYVREKVIIADERVDCMYMTFRPVELALSESLEDSVTKALFLRFKTRGRLDMEGKVMNYDDRYQYGMDMICSGKFGRDITAGMNETSTIRGERGLKSVTFLKKEKVVPSLHRFMSGDVVFFVKEPERRVVGEIIGHIGIIAVRDGVVYLIHARGRKNGSGVVTKVLFEQYLADMPFVGIVVTRID